jgi:hypothetical protein
MGIMTFGRKKNMNTSSVENEKYVEINNVLFK